MFSTEPRRITELYIPSSSRSRVVVNKLKDGTSYLISMTSIGYGGIISSIRVKAGGRLKTHSGK